MRQLWVILFAGLCLGGTAYLKGVEGPGMSMPVLLMAAVALVSAVAAYIIKAVLDRLAFLDDFARIDATVKVLEDPTSLKTIPCPSLFEPPSKFLSLILPAYNEEKRLPLTLDEAIGFLKQRFAKDPSFTFEVLVVDDGSKDATVRVAFDYVRKHSLDLVRVVPLGANYGKGFAVKQGIMRARGQVLLFADADGATNIVDTIKLIDELRQVAVPPVRNSTEGTDASAPATLAAQSSPQTQSPAPALWEKVGAAVGSRAHLEEKAISERKWYRNFLMHGFHALVLLVAGGGVRDTQCGFKMFTRRAAQMIFQNQRLQRWCFDVEIVYLAKKLKIPIKEVSVNWTEIPGSKMRPTSILHMLWEMLLIFVAYRLRFWVIRS
eukprot:jgi/Mesvir1/7939/Mv11859-RA.1